MENRLALRHLLAGGTMAVVLAFGLSACGSSSTSTTQASQSTGGQSSGNGSSSTGQLASKLPASLRQSGTIKIATAVGNPPYESVKPGSTQPVGFDMDLIRLLSKQLGLVPNIQAIPFEGVVPGLQSGRYDAAISSLTMTGAREQVINLLGYLKIGTGILVTKGNPHHITSLGAACGKTVGVAKGSANEIPVQQASKQCSGSSIKIVETEGNDLLALQSGRVDASIMDAAAAAATAKAQPGEFEVPTPSIYGAALAGIGFPKKDTQLAKAYQAALQASITNGDYSKLLDKWSIPNLAYEKAALNPNTGA